jgi:pimeloyl-ACP methyl ester carboxylesterase
MEEAAARLAPGLFQTWIHVFLPLPARTRAFRQRGAALAAGPSEPVASGPGQRGRHLLYRQLTTDHVADAEAGLAALRLTPVSTVTAAVVGHSFGGMLTLLSGETATAIRAE